MTTPARVSGPGALSQRTDGGQKLMHLPDAKYGADKAMMEQQRAAPLAKAPELGAAGGGMAGLPTSAPPGPGVAPSPAAPPQAITPFDAPSALPDQHVSTGMQAGSGAPGPRPVEVKPSQLSDALAPYFAADDTGILADFAWKLSEMGL